VRSLRFALFSFAAPLLGALAGCKSSSPTQSATTGSLQITISGLPSGPASVNVTGPNGYAQVVSASTTLANLTPGTYTVTANNVVSGSATYTPSPKTNGVSVSAGNTLQASVTYSLSTGALTVTVSGLPGGTNGSVQVTGPASYSHLVTATTTLSNLAAGSYTLSASSVFNGVTYYDPAPGSQNVNVTVSLTPATATVAYAPSTGLNLSIDALYITQSTQTYTGSVPLVKDRNGYLRVFVKANQPNALSPQVRVRWYSSGTLFRTDVINAPSAGVPTAVNEAALASSWNLAVPGSVIQPNLSVLADVDPTNLITESNETDNTYPLNGTPLALTVQTTQPAKVTLIPVHMNNSGFTGNVNAGNQDSYMTFTQQVHPIASYQITLHAQYNATTTDSLENTSGSGWLAVLHEIEALHTAEGAAASQHYAGIVHPRYTGGIAGLGDLPGSSVVSWDRSIYDEILAHEIGHNWGRYHAPCGGPSQIDPNWPTSAPYANALIGVYGFDLTAQTQWGKDTTYDLMSYCHPYWISDYMYSGVLSYRATSPAIVGAAMLPAEPALLVWGRMDGNEMVLEPAFELTTAAAMPEGRGAYRIEGLDASGGALFSYAFAGHEVADLPGTGRVFAFAIPLRRFDVTRLAGLRLSGAGREVRVSGGPAAAAARVGGATVSAVRTASGRSAVTWDAASYPMAMVRDARTGQVLSFARGGSVEVDGEALEVTLSDGVRSVRTTVQPR
jgi:hypothetical protein